MKTYKYALLPKLMYRYATVPISLILLSYFFISISQITSDWYYIIVAIVNVVILFYINKFYLNVYKLLPFVVTLDKEGITASNFMFGKNVIVLKYEDIDRITGGVFGYNPKGLIYIHESKNGNMISIHPAMEDANNFFKFVLDNIHSGLRDELVAKLKRNELKR